MVTGANSSNVSFPCDFNEDFKYILLPVSYSLVFVFGLALNCAVMYAIMFQTRRWRAVTVYMLNLTVCDTLYVLTLPFLIFYYADENDWPFGEPLCKLIRFLFYTNLYGSILFLSCISLQRFLGVCHPVRSLGWAGSRSARRISAAVWLAVVSFQAPILYFSRTRQTGAGCVCHDTTSRELFPHFLAYSGVVSMLLFCVPFAVVVACYGLMLHKLLEAPPVPGSAAARSKQRSVRMIAVVLMAFLLCFLPFHVTRSVYYSFRYLDQEVGCKLLAASNAAYKATRPLASANSCLDPILYFMAGRGFRWSVTGQRNIRQPPAAADATLPANKV